MMECVTTGVEKLDELLSGGIPRRSIVVISGPAGSGKTTLCAHFIHEGAKNNESGVFITLEAHPDKLQRSMLNFGFDFKKLEEEGKALVSRYDSRDLDKLVVELDSVLSKVNAKRLVIDPASLILLTHSDKATSILCDIIGLIQEKGCTTLLAVEDVGEWESIISSLSDGLIKLHYKPREELSRQLEVRKMSGVPHSEKIHYFDFNEKGIRIIE